MTRPPVGSTGTLAELQVEPGDVVECVDCDDASFGEIYTIHDKHPQGFTSVMCAIRHGTHGTYRNVYASAAEFCLISRANPDQTAHIVTNEGRDYDLTALEAPFGLLPEPVQEALQAWPHGVEAFTVNGWTVKHPSWLQTVSYRAVPAPTETRVQCYRGEYYKAKEHGTCIKRPDGSLDWPSWEDAE